MSFIFQMSRAVSRKSSVQFNLRIYSGRFETIMVNWSLVIPHAIYSLNSLWVCIYKENEKLNTMSEWCFYSFSNHLFECEGHILFKMYGWIIHQFLVVLDLLNLCIYCHEKQYFISILRKVCSIESLSLHFYF